MHDARLCHGAAQRKELPQLLLRVACAVQCVRRQMHEQQRAPCAACRRARSWTWGLQRSADAHVHPSPAGMPTTLSLYRPDAPPASAWGAAPTSGDLAGVSCACGGRGDCCCCCWLSPARPRPGCCWSTIADALEESCASSPDGFAARPSAASPCSAATEKPGEGEEGPPLALGGDSAPVHAAALWHSSSTIPSSFGMLRVCSTHTAAMGYYHRWLNGMRPAASVLSF